MHIIPRNWSIPRKVRNYVEVFRILTDSCQSIARLDMKTGISYLIRADSEELAYLGFSGMGRGSALDYDKWLRRVAKELVHPDFREEFEIRFSVGNLRERVYGGEVRQTYIYRCRRHADGEYRWVQAEYVVPGRKEGMDEILYYVSDISDRWTEIPPLGRRFDMGTMEKYCQSYCGELLCDKTISLAWSGILEGFYMGDEECIRLALCNVIENAIKCSRVGGDVRVTMRKSAGVGGCDDFFICVTDRGIGMTPEDLGSLFMSFSHRREIFDFQNGNGGGLGVARRIVEAMGGRMQVISEPGVGTMVEVRFSLTRAQEVPPEDRET